MVLLLEVLYGTYTDAVELFRINESVWTWTHQDIYGGLGGIQICSICGWMKWEVMEKKNENERGRKMLLGWMPERERGTDPPWFPK